MRVVLSQSNTQATASPIGVRQSRLPGPIRWNMNKRSKRRAGISLIELLCVVAIIAIMAALYLPAIARAFHRIRTFLGGLS